MATVAIVQTARAPSAPQIEEAVREVIRLAGGLQDFIKAGDMVLIKPNLVAKPAHVHSGACTSPEVCKALADIVKELGAQPVIAESAAVGVDTEMVITFMGYERLRQAGYPVVDLKRTPTVKLPIRDGEVLETITTFELVSRANVIISVPVLKTHDQCEVTLSLKNLKGLVADPDKRWIHKVGVTPGVSDLVATFKPAFALIDGIWAQEGLGPLYGSPVEMDVLIAGRDLVAVDAAGAAIMGFDPTEIPIIQSARRRGLGVANLSDIEVVGRPIEQVRRRFTRFLEDDRANLPGSPVILHAPGTCTGCRMGVSSTLWDMYNEGTFERAAEYVIVTGEVELPAGLSPEKILAVGKCCPPALRQTALYVPGCPPNNVTIKEAILKGRTKAPTST